MFEISPKTVQAEYTATPDLHRICPLIRGAAEDLLDDWVIVEPATPMCPVLTEIHARAELAAASIYPIVFDLTPWGAEAEYLQEMVENVVAGERLFADFHRADIRRSRQGLPYESDLGLPGKVFGSATEMAFRSANRYARMLHSILVALARSSDGLPLTDDAIPPALWRHWSTAHHLLTEKLEESLPDHRRRIPIVLGKLNHEIGYELCAYADGRPAAPEDDPPPLPGSERVATFWRMNEPVQAGVIPDRIRSDIRVVDLDGRPDCSPHLRSLFALVHSQQPAPEPPPCPVVLRGEKVTALVRGDEAMALSGVAYRAVAALVDAYPVGLSLPELNSLAGGDGRKAIEAARKKCTRWRAAIVMPGGSKEGYRLAT